MDLLRMLKTLEWSATESGQCPICEAVYYPTNKHHQKTCELYDAIKSIECGKLQVTVIPELPEDENRIGPAYWRVKGETSWLRDTIKINGNAIAEIGFPPAQAFYDATEIEYRWIG